ncbi:MAG: sulfurtransferase [candidate division NC10 bacterium]|nr:sulfurtransferase [candidate division NC10 bacterium]MDE2321477.1 sulfurtransferase [candidate division NC10 bacterium]
MKRMVMAAAAVMMLLAATPWSTLAAGYGNPQLLVDTHWLAQHLNDRDLQIIDMRNSPEEYAAGHIPGAVYLSVNHARVALKESGFALPPDYEIEERLGQLGITKETMVIVYDDQGGLNASRLFFTLEYAGHKKVALLNGGITKWVAEERALSKTVPQVSKMVYQVQAETQRVTPTSWIATNLGKPNLALVDARSAAEFRGEDLRAKRGGHIPGAVNIEWTQNLVGDKTFKPADELLALYERAGVTKDKTIVSYCHTMHRGAVTYFTLRLLGYPDVRGYDRSWSEWGNDPALPVQR